MDNDKFTNKGRKLNMDATCERPCTPSESLAQSLKEMKLMRQGKMKKHTWDDLKKELKNDK